MNIEKDNIHHMLTELVGGGTGERYCKLKSRMLKDLVRSFQTLVSISKLFNTDQSIWEYSLYVLLDSCWWAQKRVNILEGLLW